MSVLVVGLNHKGAPLATLERVALVGDALDKLLHDVSRADDVAGALVLSTCNRVEIYAEVGKFHGVGSRHLRAAVPALAGPAGGADAVPVRALRGRALQHLLAVACGLDSMVIGESQILGQLRHALRIAREQGTLGPTLSASDRSRCGQASARSRRPASGRRAPAWSASACRLRPGTWRVAPADQAATDAVPTAAGPAAVDRAGRPGGRRRSDERARCRQRYQGRRCQHRDGQPDQATRRAARCDGGRPGGRHVRPG